MTEKVGEANAGFEEYSGSRFVNVAGVTLGCISPEARDLLDAAMAAWDEHKKSLPAEYQESVYSFAYWLIRWSGLVQPAALSPATAEGEG